MIWAAILSVGAGIQCWPNPTSCLFDPIDAALHEQDRHFLTDIYARAAVAKALRIGANVDEATFRARIAEASACLIDLDVPGIAANPQGLAHVGIIGALTSPTRLTTEMRQHCGLWSP